MDHEATLRALTLELRETLAPLGLAAAYAWTIRLFALRCLAARGLEDGALFSSSPSGALPAASIHEDDPRISSLLEAFRRHAPLAPALFDPAASELALRPSPPALTRCLALLGGVRVLRGGDCATDGTFRAPDALGWAHQSWNSVEKDRLFELLRTTKNAKVKSADLLSATCIYTRSYIVQFLVQNSLGALWEEMHPESSLPRAWPYFVHDERSSSGRTPKRARKPVREIRLLDPAVGSGHFLVEAFELFYAMYLEEGSLDDPAAICAAIFEHNLHGIDIDERAVTIAAFSLLLCALDKAPHFEPIPMKLVAVTSRLCDAEATLEAYFSSPTATRDPSLRPALLSLFTALASAPEIGSLLRVEEPLRELYSDPRALRAEIEQICLFFDERAPASAKTFRALVDLVTRRYDVICMNPPYIGFRKLDPTIKTIITRDPFAKIDIYVAFLSRFFDLLDCGILAAVSPSSWTTSSLTLPLRRKMLEEGGPRIVVALGQRVFESAPLLFVSLEIIERSPKVDATDARPLITLRPRPGSGREGLLRAIQRGGRTWPRALIQGLEALPFLPVAPLELLERARDKPTVAHFFSLVDGVWTGRNERDLREAWEVAPDDPRWIPISGGQGYARYHAPTRRRIKALHAEGFGAHGARAFALEYARVAGGKLSARLTDKPSVAVAGVVSLLPREGAEPRRVYEVAALFNARLGTMWLRTLTSGLNFNPGYASRIPLATDPPDDALVEAVKSVVEIKKLLSRRDLTCDDFFPSFFEGPYEEGFAAFADSFVESSLELTLSALERETEIERALTTHLGISGEASAEIDLELGVPAGAFPLELKTEDGDDMCFGAPAGEDTEGEADDEPPRALPFESDLEALSRARGIHPRALLETGALSPQFAESIARVRALRRRAFVEDWITLAVLRLFGHRFAGEKLPEGEAPFPAKDGILLLDGSEGEPGLVELIQQRLTASFGGAATRQIELILEKPLSRWLEQDFFRVHAVRFSRRPIVWHLKSSRVRASKRPLVSVYLYYHRLSEHTLPALRERILRPRIERLLAERGPAEMDRSLEELMAFDEKLARVIEEGFASGTRDLSSRVEARYAPSLDDGVRINIAPLQRAGLLAAELLARHDLERALSDRSAWRSSS